MNPWKVGNAVALSGVTLIVAAMGLFGGAWWSYLHAIGTDARREINTWVPNHLHMKAAETEIERGRAEAARAFDSAKRLDRQQTQLIEQRDKVSREKGVMAAKLKSVRSLLDQAHSTSNNTLDVTKLGEEAERLLRAHDQRAQVETKLGEQAAKIEKLKNELIAAARQTLERVDDLRTQVEVAKSESHVREAKEATDRAQEIINRLNARRESADNIETLLNEMKSLDESPVDDAMVSELVKRIDRQLTQ